QLSAQNHPLRLVHPVKLENLLRRIHPDAANLLHGRPPLLSSQRPQSGTSMPFGGRPPQQEPPRRTSEQTAPGLLRLRLAMTEQRVFRVLSCSCENNPHLQIAPPGAAAARAAEKEQKGRKRNPPPPPGRVVQHIEESVAQCCT